MTRLLPTLSALITRLCHSDRCPQQIQQYSEEEVIYFHRLYTRWCDNLTHTSMRLAAYQGMPLELLMWPEQFDVVEEGRFDMLHILGLTTFMTGLRRAWTFEALGLDCHATSTVFTELPVLGPELFTGKLNGLLDSELATKNRTTATATTPLAGCTALLPPSPAFLPTLSSGSGSRGSLALHLRPSLARIHLGLLRAASRAGRLRRAGRAPSARRTRPHGTLKRLATFPRRSASFLINEPSSGLPTHWTSSCQDFSSRPRKLADSACSSSSSF